MFNPFYGFKFIQRESCEKLCSSWVRTFLFLLVQKHEVVCHDVADVQVDDPVHEVEADEAYGKHDAGILVDVTGCDSVQLVDVFARVDEMLGRRGSGLFVSTPIDRVLQSAALRVDLRVVNFESHLLEQRAWPKPQTTYKVHNTNRLDVILVHKLT